MKKYPDFSAHIVEYILRLSAARDSYREDRNPLNSFDSMKRGLFKVKDWDQSDKIAQIYKRSTFVVAIIRLSRDPQFDNDEVIRKIQINPRSFVPCVNSDEFIRMIEDIVNFRSRNKIRYNV